MSNEELVKTIQMLKRGAIHTGSDPQSSGMQQSNTDVVPSDNTPPGKKPRVDGEEEDPEDGKDTQTPCDVIRSNISIP